MPSRIEDYALIGDCEAAALVGRDGSIDWLCWPRFDSDACFAALLGWEEHGRWRIAPRDAKTRVTRRYRGDSLILETRFETSEGAVLLVDFMPFRTETPNIIRLVVGERGHVVMDTELVLRFGYGAIVPWVTRLDDGTLCAIAGPEMVLLRTSVHLVGQNIQNMKTLARSRSRPANRYRLCSPTRIRTCRRRHRSTRNRRLMKPKRFGPSGRRNADPQAIAPKPSSAH